MRLTTWTYTRTLALFAALTVLTVGGLLLAEWMKGMI